MTEPRDERDELIDKLERLVEQAIDCDDANRSEEGWGPDEAYVKDTRELVASVVSILRESVPRCDHCQWWVKPDNSPAVNGMGHCRLITTVNYERAYANARAVVPVESPTDESLYTAPDFGCVQFAAKAKE